MEKQNKNWQVRGTTAEAAIAVVVVAVAAFWLQLLVPVVGRAEGFNQLNQLNQLNQPNQLSNEDKLEEELMVEQWENYLQDHSFASESNSAEKGLREDVLLSLLNFDVVVNNAQYTIYRSSLLGRMGLAELKKYLAKQQLPFPKTIIYMNKQGYNPWMPPLIGHFAVEEFLGQEEYGHRFYHSFDYGQRTYVDGDDPYAPSEDIDAEKKLLGEKARQLFGTVDDGGMDGGVDNFLRVLEIVLDEKNSPVLFHCFGGRHRTGMVGLALRYIQAGKWVTGEKQEVYVPALQKKLWLNPAQLEYFKHNKELFREKNLEFVEKFSKDERFLHLQERFSKGLNASK